MKAEENIELSKEFMNTNKEKEPSGRMTRKSCGEFRRTGLLLFVNQFLHIFGWVIVVQTNDNDDSVIMYPARFKGRGFYEKDVDEAYIKLSKYMDKESETLLKEAQEEQL
jgi:hypothetical protein